MSAKAAFDFEKSRSLEGASQNSTVSGVDEEAGLGVLLLGSSRAFSSRLERSMARKAQAFFPERPLLPSHRSLSWAHST